MPRIRLLLPVLVAAAACVFALPAAAVPLPRPAGNHEVTTAHFVVHYYTDVDPKSGAPAKDYSTETDAGDVAAYAERAYALYASWGLRAPANDGDGHVDIYLNDLSGLPGVIGYAQPDRSGPAPSSGAIVLSTPTQMHTFATAEGLSLADEEQKSIAHELFHLVQFATWVPTSLSDMWLLEGSAQWAGLTAIGAPSGPLVSTVGPSDVALNCRDDIPGQQMCNPDAYVDGGYSRWAFYQLLKNRFGATFLESVLANGVAGQSAIDALSSAIAAKGATLTDVFTDYANAMMTGGFGIPSVASVRPPAHDNVVVGAATATLPALTIPVDHLSVRYVTFQRGSGSSGAACYAASLTITVTLPSGTNSRPYFVWDVPGSSSVPLTVNGGTATATVPWDTCDWGATRGWLSLPNASIGVDAADFRVSTSLAVDTTTPASASAAPAPANVNGQVVPAPTSDVAPLIDVFGPELLRISAKEPQIRLIVESSGPGTLQATLGSTVLGSNALRAGNNDLRFAVPVGLLAALRHTSAAGANVLTLTPMSTGGGATGTAVTRVVSITPATKKQKHH